MQEQQQQQQRQKQWLQLSHAHASAVLWQLAALAALEQQQLAAAVRLGTDSCQVLQALCGSSFVRQLLQAVLSTKAPGDSAAKRSSKSLYVAVGAVAKLAAVVDAAHKGCSSYRRGAVDAVCHNGQSHAVQARLGAAAAVNVVTTRGSSSLQHLQARPEAAFSLASIGVDELTMQQLCDALLAVAAQQPQQQHHQEQALWLSGCVEVLLDMQQLLDHMLRTQQQQEQLVFGQEKCEPAQQELLRPPELLRQSSIAVWLCSYANVIQPRLARMRTSRHNSEQLTRVLTVLAEHKAWQLPVSWYIVVERSVVHLVKGLVSPENRLVEPAAAAALLQAWVQLLLICRRQQRQPRQAVAGAGGMAAGQSSISRSSSTGTGGSGQAAAGFPASSASYKLSSRFRSRVCQALLPHLLHLDPKTLGVVAWSVAALGPEDRQQWLERLMPAVAAAAAVGTDCTPAGSSSSSSSCNQQASSVCTVGAAAAAAAPSPGLPPKVVLQVLQSFVLLRCRPQLGLIQQLLAAAAGDMALCQGSVLVGLLLSLVQLRVRPGAGWVKGVMMRLQGKLRMLCFEELTQVCDELAGFVWVFRVCMQDSWLGSVLHGGAWHAHVPLYTWSECLHCVHACGCA